MADKKIITNSLIKRKHVLPDIPVINDLFKFSNLRRPKRWRRNRRLYKKFKNQWVKYVPKRIFIEFTCKSMMETFIQRFGNEGFNRKIFEVEPLSDVSLSDVLKEI